MKFKVKFRLAEDRGEQKKLSINLEEGAQFAIGQKTLGLKSELGHLEIRDQALWVKLPEGVTLNGQKTRKSALRPGDILQAGAYTIEFLELPHKAEHSETQFLDISKMTEAQREATRMTRMSPRPEPAKEPKPEPKAEPKREATIVQPKPKAKQDPQPDRSYEPSRATETVELSHESPAETHPETKPETKSETKSETRLVTKEVQTESEPSGRTASPKTEARNEPKRETEPKQEVPAAAAASSAISDRAELNRAYQEHLDAARKKRMQIQQEEAAAAPVSAARRELENDGGTQMTRFARVSQARTELLLSVGLVTVFSAMAGTVAHVSVLGSIAAGLAFVGAFSGIVHALRGTFQIETSFSDLLQFWGYSSALALPVAFAFHLSVAAGDTALILAVAGSMFWMWRKFQPATQPFAAFSCIFTAIIGMAIYPTLENRSRPRIVATVEVAPPSPDEVETERLPASETSSKPVPVTPIATTTTLPPAPTTTTTFPAAAVAPVSQAAPAAATIPVAQAPAANRVVDRMSIPDPLATEQFFSALKAGNLKVVRDLIQRKAVDPNFTLERGNTALMFAAAYGHLNLVKYLTSLRVSLNAQDPNGTTALMWSVYRGHIDVAKFLIERGADLSLRRDDGDRAIDIARRWNRSDILAMLEDRAQDPQGSSSKGSRSRLPASKSSSQRSRSQNQGGNDDSVKLRSLRIGQ